MICQTCETEVTDPSDVLVVVIPFRKELNTEMILCRDCGEHEPRKSIDVEVIQTRNFIRKQQPFSCHLDTYRRVTLDEFFMKETAFEVWEDL